jgi:tetratricopeptide (TPR) repeat protein
LLVVVACIVTARADLPRWANPVTLWKDTIRKGPHPTAYLNLAAALLELSENQEGLEPSLERRNLEAPDATSHSPATAGSGKAGTEEAIANLREALRRWPDFVEAHNNLGMALKRLGQYEEAVASLERAHQLKPEDPDPCNNIAWLRATCPNASLRDGAEAVRMAEQACRLTGERNPDMLDTLAAAYAEAGRFQEAVETASGAVRLFRENCQEESGKKAAIRLNSYRDRKPWRE